MNLEVPHRRYNPLTGEWVLVSPHRAKRPWQGQVERLAPENLPSYDPDCYLCPGNRRAGDQKNPNYTSTFVFDNDFPALLPPTQLDPRPSDENSQKELFFSKSVDGICRVVCFSPRHDLTLPRMSIIDIENVLTTWSKQTLELGSLGWINYVQVFENKGAMMGCSNPHPHSQIWATSDIPNEPSTEIANMINYRDQYGTCLLCDYLNAEHESGLRVVSSNNYFSAIVPFWAIWPFELLIVAHRHKGSLADLTPAELSALADIMKNVTTRYDNLFETSFPYSMGFHQAPTDSLAHSECHLHLHFYPPLLRSATVRKFMVGFEMLSMPQRDLTPETAAERLKSMDTIHYRDVSEWPGSNLLR